MRLSRKAHDEGRFSGAAYEYAANDEAKKKGSQLASIFSTRILRRPSSTSQLKAGLSTSSPLVDHSSRSVCTSSTKSIEALEHAVRDLSFDNADNSYTYSSSFSSLRNQSAVRDAEGLRCVDDFEPALERKNAGSPSSVLNPPSRHVTIIHQGWVNGRFGTETRKSTKSSDNWYLYKAVLVVPHFLLYSQSAVLGIKSFDPTLSSLRQTIIESDDEYRENETVGQPEDPASSLATKAPLFSGKDPHPNTVRNAKGLVERGTLESICHEIMFPDHRVTQDYINILCSSICLWASPHPALVPRELARLVSLGSCAAKCEHVVSLWCRECPSLFLDETFLEATRDYIRQGTSDYMQSRLLSLLDDTLVKIMYISDGLDTSNVDSRTDLLTPLQWLSVDAQTLAEEIKGLHMFYLKVQSPAHDINLLFSPSLSSHPLVSIQLEENYLSNLVLSHLLECTDGDLRVNLLRHWMLVGQYAKELDDLPSWIAIMRAICSPPVLRLRSTWEALEEPLGACIDHDWSLALADINRSIYSINEHTIGGAKPHVLTSKPREANRQSDTIPWFGDIRYYARTTSAKTVSQHYIDLPTIFEIYIDTREALARWNESLRGHSASCNVEFKPFTNLQRTLSNYLNCQNTRSINEWLKLSLTLEPRRHDFQVGRQYVKEEALESGLYLPLMFTDIIYSYKLFESTDLMEAAKCADTNARAFTGSAEHIPLRRTFSYPPSAAVSQYTTGNKLLDVTTQKRVALLQNKNLRLLTALRDFAGIEHSTLLSRDGKLIFKTHNLPEFNKRASIVETSSKRLSASSKRSSLLLQTPVSPRSRANDHFVEDVIQNDVVIMAGTLDRLLDVLVVGVDDFGFFLAPSTLDMGVAIPRTLKMDMAEYTATFLATFRSFCSPAQLLENLEKRLVGARFAASRLHTITDFPCWKFSDLDLHLSPDKWLFVIRTQIGILEIIQLWVSKYFFDFFDNDQCIVSRFYSIMQVAKLEKTKWPDADTCDGFEISSDLFDELHQRLLRTFAKKSLNRSSIGRPVLSSSSIPSLNYNLFNRGQEEDFLKTFERIILSFYQNVRLEDWMSTFEIFELQCNKPQGFLPAVINIPDSIRELEISDIITLLQRVSWVKGSGSLLDNLPVSVKRICELQKNLTQFVVSAILDVAVTAATQARRIQTCLKVLAISQKQMSPVEFFQHLGMERNASALKIPSFIASCVSNAILSPLVRDNTQAWNLALNYPKKWPDDLEEIINDNEITETGNLLAPSLSWLLTRMLEIACYVPASAPGFPALLNFDKRRYIFNLFSNFLPDVPNKVDIDIISLLENLKKMVQKLLGTFTIERPPSSLSPILSAKPIFDKLLNLERQKLKRDKLQRDWFDRRQQKLRMTNVNKLSFDKERLKSSHLAKRGVNSFLKVVRPFSLVISSNSTPEKAQRVLAPSDLPNITEQTRSLKPSFIINLVNARIYPVINDRPFLFRVRTEDGHDYHLQATSDKDMQDWIQELNDVAASSAAQRSLSFAFQDSNLGRPNYTKSEISDANGAWYGISLSILQDRHGHPVPDIAEMMMQEVEKRGLNEVGIYRIPGSISSVNALKLALDSGDAVYFGSDKYKDINVVAGALKQWLRHLPEPLLTYDLYEDFVAASKIADHKERLLTLKNLIVQLPDVHYAFAGRIFQHLKRIADNDSVNNMYPENLAIVFAPNLLHPKKTEKSLLAMAMDSLGSAQQIVKLLIVHQKWVFSAGSEEGLNDILVPIEGSGKSYAIPARMLVPDMNRLASASVIEDDPF